MNHLKDMSMMMTATMAAQKEPHNPSIDQRMETALSRIESQALSLRRLADALCGNEVPHGQEMARPAEARSPASDGEPLRISVFGAIDSSIDQAHYLSDRIGHEIERIAARACIPAKAFISG